MKKLFILMSCTVFFACNKNGKEMQNQTSGNSIVWAETSESNLPMVQDSAWSKEEWDKAYKLDKDKIFNSITRAVLSGKLKAYSWYPENEVTIPEFKAILVSWASTHQVEDINHPGTFQAAAISTTLTGDDIAQLRFDEKIEYDTITSTVSKKVSVIQFIGVKKNPQTGEVMGLKKLFDVKLPEGTTAEAKK